MDIDEPGWPVIDDFFRAEAEGRSAATVRRYARVRQRLMTFLDTADMSLGLGTHQVSLLESERQFHDTGAFWSLYGLEELVCCLPSFLHETWLPEHRQEAGTQISLVSRLLAMIGRHRDFDRSVASCALYEADDAVRRARIEVRERSAEPGDATMPTRFLQQPGPEW
jgi:hypothetical protein